MRIKRQSFLWTLGASWLCLQVMTTPVLRVVAAPTNESVIVEESSAIQEEKEAELSPPKESLPNENEQTSEATSESSKEPEETSYESSKETEPVIGDEETSIQSSVSVSTWAQYAAAINNQSVTVINVTANISGNTQINRIQRSLTINGNGHTINSQNWRYEIGGGNGTVITINNTTMIHNSRIDATRFNTLFQVTADAQNASFIFRNFNYTGPSSVLGLTVINENNKGSVSSIIFDGGTSNILNDKHIAGIRFAETVRIQNNSTVNYEGRTFLADSSIPGLIIPPPKNLIIDTGSTLKSSSRDSMIVDNIQNHGILELTSDTHPVGSEQNTDERTVRLYPNSTTVLKSNKTEVFRQENMLITIFDKAEFDFISSSRLAVVHSNIILDISSKNLALWDLGLQNEEKASMVFSNIDLQLAGINGSEIISTNNERFQRLYDPSGLANYSRMSNRSVEEMTRTVIAKYLDTEGNEIIEPEVITGLLGDNYQTKGKIIPGYQLVENPSNESGEFSRETIEVSYIYGAVNVTPKDPLDPETEINPESKPELPEDQGLLSIDFASTFKFGVQAISVHDQTYYAQPQRLLNADGTVNEEEERPNYIQISDRRPENERNGWQLAVTQNGQFKTSQEEELQGARLSFTNQALATAQGGIVPDLQQTNPLALVPDVKRVLVMAQGEEGTGTWIYRFGDQETAGRSVALTVPKGSNPHAKEYKTSLTWELSAVPGNE